MFINRDCWNAEITTISNLCLKTFSVMRSISSTTTYITALGLERNSTQYPTLQGKSRRTLMVVL